MSQDAHCVLKSKIDALCGWWCRNYTCLTVNMKVSLLFSCDFSPIGLFPVFHIQRLEFLCRYVLCRKSQVSYPLISIPIFQLQSLLLSIVYSHSLFFFVSGVFWRDDIGNRWIFVIDEVSVIPVWPRIYFFLYASTWPSFNFVCFRFFLFFTWPVLVWSLLGYFEL